MELPQNIIDAIDETLARKNQEIRNRISIGKQCSTCKTEIGNVCGVIQIYEEPCACCNPNDSTRYYCTSCFLRRLSLGFLKSEILVIENEKQKEQEKKKLLEEFDREYMIHDPENCECAEGINDYIGHYPIDCEACIKYTLEHRGKKNE